MSAACSGSNMKAIKPNIWGVFYRPLKTAERKDTDRRDRRDRRDSYSPTGPMLTPLVLL